MKEDDYFRVATVGIEMSLLFLLWRYFSLQYGGMYLYIEREEK